MPSLLPRHGFSSACHPKPATLYASMRATAQATATGRAMCSINIFHEPSGRIVSPGSDDSSADDLGGSTAAGLRCRLAAGIQPHLRCALPAPAAGDGLEDFRIGFNELGLLLRRITGIWPMCAAISGCASPRASRSLCGSNPFDDGTCVAQRVIDASVSASRALGAIVPRTDRLAHFKHRPQALSSSNMHER